MSWLLFTMNLTSESETSLVKGQLAVMDDVQSTMSFEATSGFPTYQYINAQNLIGRGPIPACKKIGINAYTVRTSPFDLVNIASEDNVYFIEPTPVDVDGVMRGEFGIQFDGDIPGSSGCIGLLKSEDWQNFQNFMTNYQQQGFDSINLIVEYNETSAQPKLVNVDDSVITIDSPQAGEFKKVDEPITFSGTAKSQVANIIATVGLEELFNIGEVKPTGGMWNFSVTLDSAENRNFKFRALDEFGDLLQVIEFALVLDIPLTTEALAAITAD